MGHVGGMAAAGDNRQLGAQAGGELRAFFQRDGEIGIAVHD